MSLNEESIRLIFGLKLKQLRSARKLSLAELGEKAGMSVSYLNEIEKGKKYPGTEKLTTLAAALEIPYDRLVSLKLDSHLRPVGDILRTRLLDELPLGLFGIDKGKLIEIIASAPLKVSAFISTLLRIAKSYELTQENFYFAMLRSYQEMHGNHFEELESAAAALREEYGLPEGKRLTSDLLKAILLERFGYEVKESTLEEFPELRHIRSVYIADARRIVVNAKLAENQKAFLYAKEIGYQSLGLSGERALMTPWPRATSFDHVLNNSRASYLAGALLIPSAPLLAQMDAFFSSVEWDGGGLVSVLEEWNSSPEMFMIRLTNLLPVHIGGGGMTMMRFDHRKSAGKAELKKQLNLSRHTELPSADLLTRHVTDWAKQEVFSDGSLSNGVRAHIHRFTEPDGQRSWLVMALSRITGRDPDFSLAVAVGFEETAAFRKRVRFADDPSIPATAMAAREADEQREARFKAIEQAMKRLMEEERAAATDPVHV